MRFPYSFTRYKNAVPAGSIALGGDSAPTTTPPAKQDNVLSHLTSNVNGFPTQRLAFVCGYAGTGDVSALTLPVQVYFWEATTQRWYALGASQSVSPNGGMIFFDTVGAVEYIGPSQGLDMPRPGNEEVMFIVGDNSAPDGVYTFAACPDLTNSGT